MPTTEQGTDTGSGPLRVIGLMSGTSYDAIDVAAAEFDRDGDTLRLRPLGAVTVDHDPDLRTAIGAILPPAGTDIGQVCRLDTALGQAFAEAAARGVTELCGGRADLVVSHGQTVYHWVERGEVHGTLQLGQPAFIAERTGLPVLSDLRSADVAAGGQGAPLVPIFDALLLAPEPGSPHRRAALNLGGIANITILTGDGDPLGYDVGPANALIDAACRQYHGEPYDAGGRHAASGRVDDRLLSDLLAEPYYAAPPPKSTGKELFHDGYLRRFLDGRTVQPDDVIATVTELTARTVATELRRHQVSEVIGAGGGLHNPVLVSRLGWLAGCRVEPVDRLGIGADAKEAYAFALLGYLSWHSLPGAVPAVTGAEHPTVLGSFTPGRGPLRLPVPAATPPTRLSILGPPDPPPGSHR